MRQRLRAVRAHRGHDGGFTLTELLIVIVILGVLTGMVVFAVGAFTDRGEEAACQADKRTVEAAVEAYRAREGDYPPAGQAGFDILTADPAGDEGPYLRDQPHEGGAGDPYAITLGDDGEVTGNVPVGGPEC
jgi:prepilin-type N-terminal cleavage/methylation domain-containing protein